MSILRLVRWLATAAAVCVVFFFAAKPLLKKRKKTLFWIIAAVVEFVAATGCAYLAVATSSAVAWKCNFLLMALYVAFAGGSVGSLIFAVISACDRKKTDAVYTRSTRIKRIVSLAAALAILAAGTVNMQSVVYNTNLYQSDKLKQAHHFIMIADLHAGSAQTKKTVENMLADIKLLQPEFIVLAGDITDEYSTTDDLEWTYEKIGKLGIPTYFIYGNHDRQGCADLAVGRSYTEEELKETIEKNGIKILLDECVLIDDDLCLLGRGDVSFGERCSVDELPALDRSRYVIMAEHQPYSYEDTAKTGADLQVSGHSHAGQYFPLEQVYQIAGYDSYGDYMIGDTVLHVSAGASGWFVPFRTARRCCYEVIALMPEDLMELY